MMSDVNEKLFHTIGEVSKTVDVAQHVLRFWEGKFSQINPIKRKGRRLYKKNDIELIKRIKHLLYEKGYTMKGVQREIGDVDIKERDDMPVENLRFAKNTENSCFDCKEKEYLGLSYSQVKELVWACSEIASIRNELLKMLNGV